MAALSRSLEYGRLKSKAVSARNYRVAFRSQSGLSFQANQSFTIELAQLQRSYLDLNCMYLQFEVQQTSAAADVSGARFDYSAYSMFNRITVSSAAGAVLEDTNYLNVYNSMLLQSQCSEEYQKGYGKTIGHAGQPGCAFGIDLPASDETPITICLPMLTGLATANRQLPLDVAAPLRFTFYVDDFKKFTVRKGTSALSDIKISNPRIVANITELSESTQVLLDQSLANLSYNINYTGIVSTHATRSEEGAGTYVANLAFRNSSINKVALIMQSQDRSADQATIENNHVISNRSTGGIKEISYFINGQRFPQQKMDLTHGVSEVWSENVLADRVLMDPTHHSSLNYSSVTGTIEGHAAVDIDGLRARIPTNHRNFECVNGRHTNLPTTLDHYVGAGTNAYGTFYSQLSLETFKSNMDGESIFSGVNALGSTFQCELVFGDDNNMKLDLYWFATVDKILSLDNLTRSWIVSD